MWLNNPHGVCAGFLGVSGRTCQRVVTIGARSYSLLAAPVQERVQRGGYNIVTVADFAVALSLFFVSLVIGLPVVWLIRPRFKQHGHF